MDRVDVEDLRGADDGRNVEITLRRRSWSNTRRFVGKPDVEGIAIDVAVHGDRLDAHLLAGPDQTAGDLAAVSDQDLFEFARFEGHLVSQKSTRTTKNALCASCAFWWFSF